MAGNAMARARGDALGGVLGALTLMGVLLSACANEPSPSPAEEGPPTAPVAIPPAPATVLCVSTQLFGQSPAPKSRASRTAFLSNPDPWPRSAGRA